MKNKKPFKSLPSAEETRAQNRYQSRRELIEASKISGLKTSRTKFISCFEKSFCAFCRRVLPDGSIRFNFTAACPNCLEKIEKFTSDLRRHKRDYARKFGGENALKK